MTSCRTLLATLVLTLALPATAAPLPAASPTPLLQDIATQTLPRSLRDFESASRTLLADGVSFCAKPTQAGLKRLQQSWKVAAASWQPLDVIQLGPLIERRSQREVNAWPARPLLIDNLLKSDEALGSAELADKGAAARGFPALEYLLFPERRLPAATYKGRRCQMVVSLSELILTEAQGLNADWPAFAAGWGRTEAESAALGDFVNLLIAGIDAVNVRKLSKPLEKNQGGGSALDRIEAWRSGSSLDHLRGNLTGVQQLLIGIPGSQNRSLSSYLRELGEPGLAERLQQQMEKAQQALAGIRQPLPQAIKKDPDRVRTLLKEVGALQHLLEQDVATLLHIDLSFNANDGD